MKINQYLSWVQNGDEKIIINSENQKCIILDVAGEEIWNTFNTTLSIDKTLSLLCDKYVESDYNQIKNDIMNFFDILIENEIIVKDE